MDEFRKVSSEIDILTTNIDFRSKIIIDVGCGVGKLTRLLAKQCHYIYGVDIAELIEKAEGFESVSNAQFKIGVGQDLPFKEDFVDIIIFFASFHHIPITEMEKAIQECFRVLKKSRVSMLS